MHFKNVNVLLSLLVSYWESNYSRVRFNFDKQVGPTLDVAANRTRS